jgi:hypothetical protein
MLKLSGHKYTEAADGLAAVKEISLTMMSRNKSMDRDNSDNNVNKNSNNDSSISSNESSNIETSYDNTSSVGYNQYDAVLMDSR